MSRSKIEDQHKLISEQGLSEGQGCLLQQLLIVASLCWSFCPVLVLKTVLWLNEKVRELEREGRFQ